VHTFDYYAGFFCGHNEYIFIGEPNDDNNTNIFFQQLCFGSFHLPPEHSSFKQKYLQGSVATHLRCDGIFKDHLTTNLLISVQMEKNQKSVKI